MKNKYILKLFNKEKYKIPQKIRYKLLLFLFDIYNVLYSRNKG